MQTLRDTYDENQKKTNKRPKSSSQFPKEMSSYIAAFAVHETYDNITTAQQMICNNRSVQGSTNSVSPDMSLKTTIDRNSAQKIIDLTFSESKETKINIDERDEPEKNGDAPKEIPEEKDYLTVDNNAENDLNKKGSKVNLVESNNTFVVEKPTNEENTNEPENKAFEAIKNPKICVSKSKKKRQIQYRIRNVDFKYKKTLKKSDKLSKKSSKLKESLYSYSVSKVVSRTSLLKSVPAKLNIIDTTDSLLMSDDDNNNSLHSSPSTTKKSFLSYSSQDTLRQKESTSSSRNEDMDSINTVSSVIRIPSGNKTPYKTEIINVSVAVAYNPNNNNDLVPITSEPYRTLYNGNIISTETLVQPPHNMLTSESTSTDTSENTQNTNAQSLTKTESSDRTLKPKSTDENTYIVCNSSDFDDSSTRSEDTLAPNSETFIFAENLRPNFPIIDRIDRKSSMERPALLDTVINMGIFPEINASSSSAVNFKDLNNVLITGNAGKYMKNATFLKKSFEAEKELNAVKNINLPSESAIKAFINDDEKIGSKFCSGEIGNYPSSMTELWDRLVTVVDTAIKRLENSLTDKIITEMKKSFTLFEHNHMTKENLEIDNEKGDTISNKGGSENDTKTEVDEILQCDLVGNQVIDNIMMKLSIENPEMIIPGVSSKSIPKIKRPKIFRDYFEVLKPPAVDSAVVEGKGDTITVSTAIPSEVDEVQLFNRVKLLFSGPVAFLRENMLVITSVPAFFVALLFVYGLIVLVLKPW